MARYVVTGATGFVGAEVAKQLRSRGQQVVALVRDREKASLLAKLGCTLHVGDITEPSTLPKAMAGADGVFHLAAWYRVGARGAEALATAVNVEGTRHVLEAMRAAGVPKGVYTSSLAVNSDTRGAIVDETYRYDGPHLSVYDRTKWDAHYRVALPAMAEGLPLVIVQPGVVYGPGDTSAIHDLLVRHLRRRLLVVSGGTTYCWAYVDDIAHVHIEAMERGRSGECYIIAGPIHTLADAVRVAARISGRRAPLGTVRPDVLRRLARLAGAVESVVPLPPWASAEMLRVAAGVTYLGSADKARRELGFAPRPLEEGLRHTLEHEMRVLGIRPRA